MSIISEADHMFLSDMSAEDGPEEDESTADWFREYEADLKNELSPPDTGYHRIDGGVLAAGVSEESTRLQKLQKTNPKP